MHQGLEKTYEWIFSEVKNIINKKCQSTGFKLLSCRLLACIIIKGKLEFGIEEERINRKKHWAGLPINSINACLINNNLTISDVTDIVINTNPYSNIKQKSIYF